MIVRNGSRGVAASLLIASLALSAAGCGTNQASPAPNNNQGITAQNVTPRAVASPGISNPQAVAAHLEQLAKGVKGVSDANCVVFGKYAIVGIDVEKTLPRSRVGTIKYAVAEAFRKDPYGVDALVTADMDLDERIREIRQDVANGRPVAGFAEELADIVGRLVPQMPHSVVPPASPDGGTTAGGGAGVPQMQTNRGTQGTQQSPGNDVTQRRGNGAGMHKLDANANGGATNPPVGSGNHNVYEMEWNRGAKQAGANGGVNMLETGAGGAAHPPVGSGNHNVYEMEWNRGQIIDHNRTSD
ncbi:YhcN/YlaJ family sporulation lipoprotein [Cohnella lubricantis]|uniref:YhcN/YlaJ family sporulation lipoprotein n=1 Tax=Cohnella lubricantis TaxID=2163172 RepID=A0A841TFH7_9BACL|nr:YhcN/YlaJ family sporulation lipoprotein [Cohnella lubricantis]MBB6678709.1 YhcN/YlaJ family sporulation lipoprotein [Cohnella lubricantis]MBP2119778.1 YhcN/YlaJ family sporulation lipoprotein [Cohnella lubricantis]